VEDLLYGVLMIFSMFASTKNRVVILACGDFLVIDTYIFCESAVDNIEHGAFSSEIYIWSMFKHLNTNNTHAKNENNIISTWQLLHLTQRIYTNMAATVT
jgi:hypothetical protein